MGIPIMIYGESGSGKSTSMRNFKDDEIGVINISGKLLPFRTEIKTYSSDNYENIERVLKGSKAKTIVIDDAQYLMANEFMRNANVTGYQKFTDIAKNFWALIKVVTDELPSDVIVYFMGHVERDTNGNEKFKTIGKLLDEKITVEGLFTVVLKTHVNDGKYQFSTQTNGSDTAKSPIDMFSDRNIDNDLKVVDETIRNYWGLNNKTKEI